MIEKIVVLPPVPIQAVILEVSQVSLVIKISIKVFFSDCQDHAMVLITIRFDSIFSSQITGIAKFLDSLNNNDYHKEKVILEDVTAEKKV